MVGGRVVKVSRADRAIRPLLVACYPDWKGRKVSVSVATSYQMSDYWSEGSRHYVRAFDLATGKIADHAASNPFRDQAHARVTIPDGIALVEHSIFCGKDAGITIYVTAGSLARLLPGNASARTCKACPRALAPTDPVDGICDHCARSHEESRALRPGEIVDAADWGQES
jgi:hypothetical protein